MKTWNQITPVALLGVSRGMPALDMPSPFDELLIGSEGEEKLLKACGILGVAGAAARVSLVTNEALPEAAPGDEQHRDCPPQVSILARRFLEEGRPPLVAEMCRLLARASWNLPPRLLPSALELGRRTVALRDPLRGVLGQRGAWLARQNPDWSFAVLAGREAADRRIWDEGDAAQRALWLRRLRRENPSGAQELLAAVFPQETARDRAILLPALGENLGPDDEPFLAQTLFEDRGKEVRQIAATLLCRLPESELAREITEWLGPCIRSERKLFRTTTVIEPPAAFDPAWKAKTIEEKPPANGKLGERGWWLLQLVSLAPLTWWERRLESTPAEILALAAKSDWKDAIFGGFRLALANQPGFPDWTLAFLEAGLSPDEALNQALTLPPAKTDEAFRRIFANADDVGLASRIIDAADFPWSLELWRLVRQKLPQWLAKQDWRFRAALVQIACRVPPAALHEEQNWPDASFHTEAIAEFTRIVDQRRTLHQYLNP